uniref:Uncharacterized protein n=1 Tax=Chromera velia CCMP2878 TaxID=1169474 RepID=A0A0G4IFJ4_9ALVE|eukprot:Cvel_13931.t1-p1 / transcript=Cvel_13931.t1 / gene=Cvel_13931 / organism=Chromera_velia_CCMP2878 / gene_product=hypothetical protein / transcript_product=hypothetical protein / location=Cvel_scaffold972:592-3573(+) / protein_length=626 / sequence_SO=supercontig / SO=protein_coding / is_pseudo=false
MPTVWLCGGLLWTIFLFIGITNAQETVSEENQNRTVEQPARWNVPQMHPHDFSQDMKDCICKIIQMTGEGGSSESVSKCKEATEDSFGMLLHELHLDDAKKKAFMDTQAWMESESFPLRRRRRLQSTALEAECPSNFTALYKGFGPGYASGPDVSALQASIQNTFLSSDLTQRSDSNAVGAFLITLWAADTAAVTLEYSCDLASEPNTEFICKGALGVAEVLVSSLETVRDQIEFHDGGIDSAEIQAGFVNSESLLDRMCALDEGIQALTSGVVMQIMAAHNVTRALISIQAEEVRGNITEKAEETREFVRSEHEKTREFVVERFKDLEEILNEEVAVTEFRLDQSDEQMRIARRLLLTPEKERPGYADPRNDCGAKKEDLEDFAARVNEAAQEDREFKDRLKGGAQTAERKLSEAPIEEQYREKREKWRYRRVPSQTELLRCPPPPSLAVRGNCTADPVLCGRDQTQFARPFAIPVPQRGTPNAKKQEKAEAQRSSDNQGGGLFGGFKLDFSSLDWIMKGGGLSGAAAPSEDHTDRKKGSSSPSDQMDLFGNLQKILPPDQQGTKGKEGLEGVFKEGSGMQMLDGRPLNMNEMNKEAPPLGLGPLDWVLKGLKGGATSASKLEDE